MSSAARQTLAARLVRSSSSLSLLDQAVISGGVFVAGVLVARAVVPETFGLYVLANVVVSFAVAVQNGLLLQPFVVQGAALEEGAFRRFLAANVPLQVGYLVLSGLVLAGVALVWEPLRPLALPIAVAGGFLQAQEFCRRVLYTRGHVGAALLNNVVNYDLQVPVLAVLAVVGQLDVARALWVSAGTSLLAVGVGIGQLGRFGGAGRDALGPTLRSLFTIGRWTGASAVVSATSTQAYPIILAEMVGLVAAAGLGVIRQILGPLQLLTRPIDNYQLPRATRAVAEGGTTALNRVLLNAALIVVPLYAGYTLLVMVLPALVIGAIYGEGYVDAADALRVFALGSLVYTPVHLMKLELNARRLQRHIFVMEVWTVALVYGVGLLAIARLGLIGAGLVTVAAGLSQFLFFLVVLVRVRRSAHAERSGDPSSTRVPPVAPPASDLVVLPRGEQSCCYVPLDSWRVRWRGTDLYEPPARPGGRLFKAGMRAWVTLGGARWSHEVLPGQAGAWPLVELLQDHVPGLATAAVVSAPRPDDRVVLQLLDARGRVLAFAKYAASPSGRRRLATEARMLTVIPPALGPRLICFTPLADGDLIVESAVSGQPYPPVAALDASQQRFLQQLAGEAAEALPADQHPYLLDLLGRDGPHRGLLEQVVEQLGPEPWPVVRMHGAFTFTNLRRWQGECVGLDWEWGAERGFPYVDAAHWIARVASSVHGQTPAQARDYVASRLCRYLPRDRQPRALALTALAALHALAAGYPGEPTDAQERWWTTFALEAVRAEARLTVAVHP